MDCQIPGVGYCEGINISANHGATQIKKKERKNCNSICKCHGDVSGTVSEK